MALHRKRGGVLEDDASLTILAQNSASFLCPSTAKIVTGYAADIDEDKVEIVGQTLLGRYEFGRLLLLALPVLRSLAALAESFEVTEPRARFPAMKHARWSILCC